MPFRPCYIPAVTINCVASIFSVTWDAMHLGLGCILHLRPESLRGDLAEGLRAQGRW